MKFQCLHNLIMVGFDKSCKSADKTFVGGLRLLTSCHSAFSLKVLLSASPKFESSPWWQVAGDRWQVAGGSTAVWRHLHRQVDEALVVRPGAELELALLLVEGEPGHVDLAGGLEDAGGDLAHAAPARHHQQAAAGSAVRTVSCHHSHVSPLSAVINVS